MNVLEQILEEIEGVNNVFCCDICPRKDKRINDCMEHCEDELINKIIDTVRSHVNDISDEKDGWVPVYERLPQERGWYQCTCSDKEIWRTDIVRDLYYDPEVKEFVDNVRYQSNGLRNRERYYWTKYVTAWQMLPEAYKGE